MDTTNFFDFDFGANETQTLDTILRQARDTVNAGLLGAESSPQEQTRSQQQADDLLNSLSQQVARFASEPEVFRFDKANYTSHGLPVPTQIEQILEENRIYWVHFPIIMHPQEDRPFTKIKVAVEFNPGVDDGQSRPRALTILPEPRFRDRLAHEGELKLSLNANLEFEAHTGDIDIPIPTTGSLGLDSGLTTANVARLGLTVFPFTYRLRAAEITNSAARAEQVYWTVKGNKFFQDNRPEFIVILQVPKSIASVRIAAAMQAYSEVRLADRILRLFRPNVKRYLEAGAPIPDQRTPDQWDITAKL